MKLIDYKKLTDNRQNLKNLEKKADAKIAIEINRL